VNVAGPVLVSVNVGMPASVDWDGRTVYTGVWKHPVEGSRLVRRLNVDGDGQGDLAGHGGEQRAVLVYQIDSYQYWQRHFGRDDLTYGNFGENLTVDGLPDDEVCIGDRYRIGEAEFEVTQPRVTCFRVGMRLGQPDLPSLLVSHHRPGFYMRVITEGHLQAGDNIVKTRSGSGALTVADTDALLYLPDRDPNKLRTAVQIPALSPGWQQSFHDLLVAEETPHPASAPPSEEPAWSGFRALRVTKVLAETPSVTSIYLSSPDGNRLPTARAGQYLTVRVADAAHPAPVRNYSLSAAPDSGTYRISVKREPHGITSSYLNRHLQAGATLEVAAPRGDFVLDADTGPLLLLSAGIGVTPVLSMLYQLSSRRSEREIWWIHAARRRQEHALAAEADTLLTSLPRAHEQIFYSVDTSDESQRGTITSGRLSAERLRELPLPARATAYVCGPNSFMDDMRQALTSIGILPVNIHVERFGALSSINPGLIASTHPPPHPPSGPVGSGPLVTFARSGLSVRFGANGRTILELAEACDISTRWSCRSGVCHTCTTPILTGRIAYSPAPLEAPRPEEVLICCAQPQTEVVLEM
jgi:ferredoxin-NADP reductase/MOSC domain-containing protein YiiM